MGRTAGRASSQLRQQPQVPASPPCPCHGLNVGEAFGHGASVCGSLALGRWDQHARDGDTECSELWTWKFGLEFLLDLTTE